MKTLVPTLLAAVLGVATAGAANLAPIAVGDPAVTTAIAGRPNLALASGGAAAFSSSDLTPDYAAPRVNDGVIDHSGNSWIPLTTAGTEFVAVRFAAASVVGTVVWSGQTGYNGRSAGTWVLQYTTDPSPAAGSTWTEIGTYVYAEPTCSSPMPRTCFAFTPVPSVTAVRLLATTASCGLQVAVQELEAYGPLLSPPTITTPPVGGTYAEGSVVTLTVVAVGGTEFQWQKDEVNIPGATSFSYTISNLGTNDAGSYRVRVANSAGSLFSDPVDLIVTPMPVYATYAEAVLTDNPIHYYPLDETSGTMAADLGTLATSGGTYAGGITLGLAAPSERLGKSALFDGNPGTLVDLGPFHPGDAITVEAWANLDPTARAEWNAIVARWDGSYELDFAPGNVANFVVRRDGNGFGLAAGATASTRGQWHHLVGVFSGGVVTLYVDGVKGSEQNIGGVLQDAGPVPDRVMIGATRTGTDASFNFKGLLDEVAIYDYALSPDRIRTHLRASLPPEPPSLTIELATLLSWPSFPPGYVLQAAPHPDGPYTTVTKAPITENGTNYSTVPIKQDQLYFRLERP